MKQLNLPHFFRLMLLCVFTFSLFFTVGCAKEEGTSGNLDTQLERLLIDKSDGTGLAFFTLPDSDDYNAIPQDPKNPINRKKVELGKLLFHETGIALNPKDPNSVGTYSCATCHHAGAGFQAGTRQGVADGGIGFGFNGEGRTFNPFYPTDSLDLQPIRTPSALNVAYQRNMLWNGQFGGVAANLGTEDKWKEGTPLEKNFLGFEGTETQAIAGLTVHRLEVDDTFCEANPVYEDLFDFTYPELAEDDRVNNINAGLAVAAYERTLLPNEAPFQKWLRGNPNAMTTREKEGAVLFFGKANCGSCHTGPALNSEAFYAIGMPDLVGGSVRGVTTDDNAHKGRGGFTGNESEMYAFKVPQLYNLADSPFYGHGGTFNTVEDVVEYKNKAVTGNLSCPSEMLDPSFQPLGLNSSEVNAIATFIESALYDANLQRYVPESVPSGNCFPNNDALSRVDLNCL